MARGDIRIFNAFFPNLVSGKVVIGGTRKWYAVPLAPDVIATVDDQDPRLSSYVVAGSVAPRNEDGKLIGFGTQNVGAVPTVIYTENFDLRERIAFQPSLMAGAPANEGPYKFASPVSWYYLFNNVVISQILIIDGDSDGELAIAFIEMRTGENNDPWDLSTYRFQLFSTTSEFVTVTVM
jgi:hypothetical protein